MRQAYGSGSFEPEDLAATWLEQLRRWLDEAVSAELPEPNAIVLATADGAGAPGARTVLVKGLDERGLLFFTNLRSRKGRELAVNPRASAVFPWHPIQRQVVVDGLVEPATGGGGGPLLRLATAGLAAGRPGKPPIGARRLTRGARAAARGGCERRPAATGVVGRLLDRAAGGRVLAGPAGPPPRPPAIQGGRRHLDRRAARALVAAARLLQPVLAVGDGLLVAVAPSGRRGRLVGLAVGRGREIAVFLSGLAALSLFGHEPGVPVPMSR